MAELRLKKKTNGGEYYVPKKDLQVNFAQDLADHAAELLWGQGYLLTHTNEKANTRLAELLRYNNADEYFAYKERLLSLFGNVYETIDMVDGKPTWTICDPYLNSMGASISQIPSTDGTINGMGRAFVSDVVAVIWKKISYGTISFPIKEIHTANKVERIFFGENGKRITVAHVNKEIPQELQVKELWEHNIGLIEGKLPTIKWSKNLPTFNAISYADGYKGEHIQTLANKTLMELYHETETNRTRLIGTLDETTYNQIMKNGDLAEINKNDFLINVKMKNSTGSQENVLTPVVANPQFDMYWLSYQKAKDEYFQLGGYSPLGDGSSEKTATENLLMKTNDYQTTKKKRNLRNKEVFELLQATITIDAKLGFGSAIYGDLNNIRKDLSFEIMENKVADSMNEIDNYTKMFELGVMSRVEMVAKIRGISKEEAQELIKDIDKEFEADQQLRGQQEQNNNQEKPVKE